MTLKTCENCDYEQQLRADRRAKSSWRCYDCGHANKLSFVIIAAILAISSLGLVYSEEINLPVDEPYDDMYCTFYALSDHVNFTCTWKWFLPDYVMEELEPLDIPLKTSDIPQHNLDLADKITLLLERGIVDEPVVEDISEVQPTEEEPLTWEERQIEASIQKLDECLRGTGAWAAYQTSNRIEGFVDESRHKFAIRDNLSQNQALKKILLAIEECDAMRYYEQKGYIGDYELNKVVADLLDHAGGHGPTVHSHEGVAQYRC